MEKELQDKLLKKYPKIFIQHSLPMSQTCMCWGFECGDGWYSLLDCLCFEIQCKVDTGEKTYKRYPFGKFLGRLFGNPRFVGRWVTKKIPQLEAIQVKEKLGGLRFYYTGGNREIKSMVSFAASMSYCICEHCGSTKNVSQTKGWIRTLCKKCLGKLSVKE